MCISSFLKCLHKEQDVRHIQGFHLGRTKCYTWEYMRYSCRLGNIYTQEVSAITKSKNFDLRNFILSCSTKECAGYCYLMSINVRRPLLTQHSQAHNFFIRNRFLVLSGSSAIIHNCLLGVRTPWK